MTDVKVTVVIAPQDRYSGIIECIATKIKTTFKPVCDPLRDPIGDSQNYFAHKENY